MIFPVVDRHWKGANRILDSAGFSNEVVEQAVLCDHKLYRCQVVRRRDADDIECKDNALIRQANQLGTKRVTQRGDRSRRLQARPDQVVEGQDRRPRNPAGHAANDAASLCGLSRRPVARRGVEQARQHHWDDAR